MKSVINASPQIFLAKAGMLHVLKDLYDEVHTTKGIAEEIERPLKQGLQAPEVKAIKNAKWIVSKGLLEEENEKAEKLAQMLRIGRGEAEAAILYKRGYDLVIVADRRAERKLKSERINAIDVVDVGFDAASKEIVKLKDFAKSIWEAGYRTERVEKLLSLD